MIQAFTQNPHGISTVRISAADNLRDPYAFHTKRDLVFALERLGYQIRQGTKGDYIQLSGGKGVQTHIRQSDAYVFFGKPTLVELFKLSSLFVGLQTLDPDLHYQPENLTGTHEQLRRPVIIYGDPKHFIPWFEHVMYMHHVMGTVRQDPRTLIRFAINSSELDVALRTEIPALSSVHGLGASPEKIAAATKYYTENTFFDYDFGDIVKPSFNAITYTSASLSSEDAYNLAREFAKNGIGTVSGAGITGSMGDIARGSHSAGGWAYGTNCAHIVAQEGRPEGMIVNITPCIYSRMADMKAHGNAIIGGAGGYGGQGTVQEILAASFLLKDRHHLMVTGKNGSSKPKPVIFDNSKGLWNGFDKVLEPFGLREGFDYAVAYTSDEVIQYALLARDGKLGLSNVMRSSFGR